MATEIWKDIPGYEGLYQVSNLGRIKSYQLWRGIRGRILSPQKQGNYHGIFLGKNNRGYIHRLVALAFIGQSNLTVNHKNGIKTDNRLENLEYVSQRDNNIHARLFGLNKSKKGSFNILSKAVGQFSINGELISKYGSAREASRSLGIASPNIINICNGKKYNKTAGGFIFKYL